MTFLRELNSTLTFQEIASVYRHACDLTSTPAGDPGLANSCTLTWIDQQVSIQPDPMTPATLVQHYGFLSGAERAFGLGTPNYDETPTLGNEHGVSHDTTPLP